MLDLSTLELILHSVASGYPDRAENALLAAEGLDEATRWAIMADVREADSPALGLTRIGDRLRAGGADRALVNECYRAAFYASPEPLELAANDLYSAFLARKGGVVVDKWPHYFRVYERHLRDLRGSSARVLEIGVYRGGGLALLRGYLGSEARLVGVDIDPVAVEVARGRYPVELGDQCDPGFLRQVVDQYGPFDVVIDDGGHTMDQQISSAEVLIPLMADGGVYIVEDTHTSYWPEFGGGKSKPSTFLEWTKSRIDDINAYHWSRETPPTEFTDHIAGMHVYDSMVVFDIKRAQPPFCEVAGTWDFLMLNRPTASVVSEILATREVAVAEAREARSVARQAEQEARQAEQEARQAEQEAARSLLSRADAWAAMEEMRRSRSWRLTSPLREVTRWRGRPRS